MMTTPAGIYDRISTAWPHLGNLADKARRGDVQARNALATSVLLAAARAPLTAQDILAVSRTQPNTCLLYTSPSPRDS